MSGNSEENVTNEEKRRRRFTRLKKATGVYIAKLIAFLLIATITIVVADSLNALLLGAFTYNVGILFDMIVLAREDSGPKIFGISILQWIATIFAGFISGIILLELLLFKYIPLNYYGLINISIRVSMYGLGIIGALLEIFYSVPYDD